MKYFLSFLSIIALPSLVHAEVLFSEIAWMGTDEKATSEWIELYNFSSTPTDVTGWTITLNDAPFITLAGSLTSHGVAVLERSSDATLPGSAFQIYTGALPNTGPTLLQLKNISGTVVDEAKGGTDWAGIGGSNIIPKMTAQRTRTGNWVTGVPTPGVENVQENATIPEGEVDTKSDSDTEESATQTSTSKKSGGGGGGGSKKAILKENPIPGVLGLSFTTPAVVYVNQPVTFEVAPSGLGPTMLASLTHTWNFGDTSTSSGKKVTHTFSYPGEYVVVAESQFAKHRAMVKQLITVVPSSFVIEKADRGDIVIRNTSKYEADIGSYTVKGLSEFMLPKYTFVKAGGAITIPKVRFGGGVVTLHDGERVVVARSEALPVVTVQDLLPPPIPPSAPIRKVANPPSTKIPEPVVEEKVEQVAASSQVIQIGSPAETPESNGMFKRLWSRVSNIFGD